MYAVIHLNDGTSTPMLRQDAFQRLIRERLGDETEQYYLNQIDNATPIYHTPTKEESPCQPLL